MHRDPSATAADAELAVEGVVVAKWSEPNKTGGMVTHLELDLKQILRGDVQSGRILLGFPGGTTSDGVTHVAVGCPTVEIGETVLVQGRATSSGEVVVPNNWSMALLRAYTAADGRVLATDGGGRLVAAIPEVGPERFVSHIVVLGDVILNGDDPALGAGILVELPTVGAPVNVLEEEPTAEELDATLTWDAAKEAVLTNLLIAGTPGVTVLGYGTEE